MPQLTIEQPTLAFRFRFVRNPPAARFVLIALWMSAATASAKADDAHPFFDGETLDNWMTIEGEAVPDGWEVVDGVIHLRQGKGRSGHIITRDKYGDFELSFEWKIAPGGNSGIKYRVRKYGGKTLGCEYQVYDDEGSRKRLGARNAAGSLYDLYAPNLDKHLKPAGEYNSARIIVRGDRIEHWLNGAKIVVAHPGSADWNLRVAASKFSEHPDFGTNRRGRIMLTDHGSEVWYRNIKFTPLYSPEDGDEVARP